MVSERKKQLLQELRREIGRHRIVGVVDLNKLPARQLQELRESLKGKAVLRMAKKRVIALALKESGLERLIEYHAVMPALLFSDENPFRLARLIAESKSSAPCKPGDILEKDVTISAGPTDIPAGPAIGSFQKFKIHVGVEGGKIAVKADKLVAKRGDHVSADLAVLLQKLNINPVEIGLNLLAACESGTVYPKDILFIPQEQHLERLRKGYVSAFLLAVSIGYVTKDNVTLLLTKAHREAFSLALRTGFVTDETLMPLLVRGAKEAEMLKGKVKLPEAGTEAAAGREVKQDGK